MMRILYEVLFFLFALSYLPLFFLKGKHHGGFWPRFGVVPADAQASLGGRRVIWIHAVSVGEITQATRLADSLREKFPTAKFLLTTVTVTGHEVAQTLKRREDVLLYLPLDFRGCVRSFIRAVSPEAVIFMETELWPNLVFELARLRIPIFVMNGRISDKSIVGYRRAAFFAKKVLNCLTGIGVQDEQMRRRFLELGACPDLVRITGNMKFDWKPSGASPEVLKGLESLLKRDGGMLCIAGSTHEGEEAIFFKMVRSLGTRRPELRFLVAPRHLHRLPDIERAAAKENLTPLRISKIGSGGEKRYDNPTGAVVYILDQMGILASAYRLADLAFVGGSLVPAGGHNPAEPAFFGKPVLFGPFMSNFREMAEIFKQAGAAREVNASTLEAEVEALAADAEKRKAMGTAAGRLVRSHEGAVAKNIEMFLETIHP